VSAEPQTVAVLGGGTMGSGIAQASALAGCDVAVLELGDVQADAARVRIGRGLDAARDRGGVDASEVAGARDRVRITADVNELADARLVIEAIVEQFEPKFQLLGRVDAVVSPDCLITTNTSAHPITELALAVRDPGRFAGLHFFNPVHAMMVVEVVAAEQTRAGTVDALSRFVERLGKQPIPTKDRPGFLVNRLLVPYLNQALKAYDDGIATREDIDLAVQLGLGYPVGPLALLDRIGLDVHLDATRTAYDQLRDEHFAPPPVLARLVAAGHLGRKAGRGLYEYDEESG
jgi:3-hydroxybutyryl-CoA dehydrogenase